MNKNILNLGRMLALGGAMLVITACGGGQQPAQGNAPTQPAQPASVKPVLDETGGILELSVAKPEKIVGVYKREGLGIRFKSIKVGENIEFLLQSLDGQDLVRVDGNGEQFKVTSMGTYSEAARYADLRQVASASSSANSEQPKMSLGLQVKGDREALLLSQNREEMLLLPWLSRALGQFGYYGYTHPAAMPLLLMGRSVSETKNIEIPYLAVPEKPQTEDPNAAPPQGAKIYSEGSAWRWWWECKYGGAKCLLGNCPGSSDCVGMCGPKCTCWSFICGDCCSYVGCYVHDRNCGSTTWQCTLNFWQFFIGGCAPMYGA